jgi:hypothetical protein
MIQSVVKYGILINVTDLEVPQCKRDFCPKCSLHIHQYTYTHENVLKLHDGLIYKVDK